MIKNKSSPIKLTTESQCHKLQMSSYPKLLIVLCVLLLCFTLTFADASSVHHPDEGGAVLAVGGDAVLSGLEDVAVVFLHLQGAADSPLISITCFNSKYLIVDINGRDFSYNSQCLSLSFWTFFVHVWVPGKNLRMFLSSWGIFSSIPPSIQF